MAGDDLNGFYALGQYDLDLLLQPLHQLRHALHHVYLLLMAFLVDVPNLTTGFSNTSSPTWSSPFRPAAESAPTCVS